MVFTESLLDAYQDTCEPCSHDMKACQVDASKVDHLFHLLAQLDGAPSVEELYAQVELEEGPYDQQLLAQLSSEPKIGSWGLGRVIAACVLGGGLLYFGSNAFMNYKEPVANYFRKKPAPAPVVVTASEPAPVVVAKAQTDVEEEP